MARCMGKERTYGQMAHSSLENLKKVCYVKENVRSELI